MHHVMSASTLLAAGCLCVCVCVCVSLALFVQLSVSACLLSGVFLLPSGSSFQDGLMGFLAGPPSFYSSYWETMGGLPQGHEGVVCLSLCVCWWGGFIGGVVGFPSGNCRFIPAAERPSSVCVVFLCLLGQNVFTRIKTWKKSSPRFYMGSNSGLAAGLGLTGMGVCKKWTFTLRYNFLFQKQQTSQGSKFMLDDGNKSYTTVSPQGPWRSSSGACDHIT